MGVLSCVGAVPGGKPFETFGKDLDIAQKAEARDDGPTGPVTSKSPQVRLVRPSVQLPAGIHGWRGYKDFGASGKGNQADFALLKALRRSMKIAGILGAAIYLGLALAQAFSRLSADEFQGTCEVIKVLTPCQNRQLAAHVAYICQGAFAFGFHEIVPLND
jgi:hypothetical protein